MTPHPMLYYPDPDHYRRILGFRPYLADRDIDTCNDFDDEDEVPAAAPAPTPAEGTEKAPAQGAETLPAVPPAARRSAASACSTT